MGKFIIRPLVSGAFVAADVGYASSLAVVSSWEQIKICNPNYSGSSGSASSACLPLSRFQSVTSSGRVSGREPEFQNFQVAPVLACHCFWPVKFPGLPTAHIPS